tara:strand:- start:1687 stop:2664 length:978 start_codon:yes stop_codon:yes gene_type:complete
MLSNNKKINFLEKFIIKHEKLPFFIVNKLAKLSERSLRYFIYNGSYTPEKLFYEHQVSNLSRDLIKKINSENSILLITFPKSGTNWLMFMIANYLYSIKDINSFNLSLAEKSAKIFNYRNGIIWMNAKIQTSFQINEKENSYLFFQHINSAIDNSIYFQGKRILLYRNPRDWLISWHEYFGKSRPDINYRPKNISNAIDFLLPSFCKWYKFMKKINVDENDILISYEELIKDTENVLKKIFLFLNLDINEKILKESITKSSVNKVNNEERSGKKVHKNIKLANRQYFIRDPKIGQWSKYLSSNEIKKIDNYLIKNGIQPNEFIYK